MFPILSPQPRFAPANLYGLQAWYDATQTPVGAVSSWVDQSGKSNSATQGTGAQQPTSTAAQLNGNNTLLFVGASTQNLVIPAAIYTVPNGDNTLVVVAKSTSTTAQQRIISMASTGTTNYALEYTSGASTVGFQSRNVSGGMIVSSVITRTNYNIFCGFKSGTTQSISVNNGAAQTNSLGVNSATINSALIGSNAALTVPLDGGIAELLIYNRALSSSEIIAINQYLSQKWGIAIS